MCTPRGAHKLLPFFVERCAKSLDKNFFALYNKRRSIPPVNRVPTERSLMRHFQNYPILIRICALLLLLSGLVGCATHVSRPDHLRDTQGIDVFDSMEETDSQTESAPKKRIALTFDDGPQHYSERTKQIVDELAKYGYHATFFVVGNRIPGGNALSYAVEKGNEIGIHGYTHDQGVYYDTCSDERYHKEINQTAQAIRAQIPGYEIRLMRPIGGSISPDRIRTSPYAIIHWSVDSDDWNNKYYAGISDEEANARIQTIVENVMGSVTDGDIVLLHDIYESTYDATKILLQRLYEEDYEVVTVSELLGDQLEAGRLYHSTYE